MATPKLEVSALSGLALAAAPEVADAAGGVAVGAPDSDGSRARAISELKRTIEAKANGRRPKTATIFGRLILRKPIAIWG